METKVEVPVSNISAVQRVPVPKGIYTAEITKVENMAVNAKDGTHPLYTYVTYTIEKSKGGKYDGQTVRDSMPAKASPNSKLGKLLVAAGGSLEEMAKKGDADISPLLLNRKVEIMVDIRPFVGNNNEKRQANEVTGVPEFQ
jgi:hypothetical protein